MKTMIKTSLLALALMGGAAHAQQSTEPAVVDINVSVGSQCSLVSKSVADLAASGSYASFEDDTFFQVTCNKSLPYSLAFSGPRVDVENGDQLLVTLVNEKGSELQIGGRVKSPEYDFYISSPGGYTATGSGQSQDWGLAFGSFGEDYLEAEIGSYTANVTATVVY